MGRIHTDSICANLSGTLWVLPGTPWALRSHFHRYQYTQACRLVTHSSCHLVRYILRVAPFVFAPSVTMLRRAIHGENILQAHRSHLYQRLVRRGHSHAQVRLLYTALALFCGLLGLVFLWR